MAEGLAIAASIIAVIQISDRIISSINFYVEALNNDLLSDLQVILTETTAIRTAFKKLQSLDGNGLQALSEPVTQCEILLKALEGLLPPTPTGNVQATGNRPQKRRKLEVTKLTLAWPLKEQRAKKILDNIGRYKSTIHLLLSVESLTESQRHDVDRWLVSTDPSPLHNQATHQIEPGTTKWMLAQANWSDWVDAKFRCLWIRGIPGAGKTVLMSYLIEQLRNHVETEPAPKTCLVYYYCYFGHNTDESIPFLRWLLRQLCRQADIVPKSLFRLYKAGTEPRIGELLCALRDICDHFERVYVVVDALDESTSRTNILEAVRELSTSDRFCKIQILVSSREYPEIVNELKCFATAQSMDNDLVREAIRICVSSLLRSKKNFRHWPSVLFDEVEEALSTGAQGMFRWAVCQVDILRLLKGDRAVIQKALKNLPTSLYDTYDRILLSIDAHERLYVLHALLWTCNSQHTDWKCHIPTTTLSLAALKSASHFDLSYNERFYDFSILEELLGCLIRVNDLEYPRAMLAHYTVKEYLDAPARSNVLMGISSVPMSLIRDNIFEVMLEEVLNLEASSVKSHDISQIELFCAITVSNRLNQYRIYEQLNDKCISLIVDCLDPSRPHYRHLRSIGTVRVGWRHFIRKCGPLFSFIAFAENCGAAARENLEAIHFLSLYFLWWDCSDITARKLTQVMLAKKEAQDFLKSRLSVRARGRPTIPGSWFVGTVSDFILSYGGAWGKSLLHRMDYLKDVMGVEFIDTSYLILTHKLRRHCCLEPEAECETKRRLKTGSDPNFLRHSFTLLQLATSLRDFECVEMLLQAGADPNALGEAKRAWDGTDPEYTRAQQFSDNIVCMLSSLSELLTGVSPLIICRYFTQFAWDQEDRRNLHTSLEADNGVEELLLSYGAVECSKEPFESPPLVNGRLGEILSEPERRSASCRCIRQIPKDADLGDRKSSLW